MEKSGLLLVDKPEGLTSHQVVGKIRHWLGQKSVGHAGTLDPLATGLLVILVGKATKISDYILNGDKGYRVRIQLGFNTDTDDITGEVTERFSTSELNKERIITAANKLQGELEIPVPIYSAIKQKGKKLYELARKNVAVDAPIRRMNFRRVEILDVGDHWLEVRLSCAKGGYIRSWAKELGRQLGCGATVEVLRREMSYPYDINDALPLMDLVESDAGEMPMAELNSWIPLEKALPQWPTVKIEGLEEKLIINGQIPRRLERYLEIQYGGSERLLPGVKVLSRRSGRLLSLLSHESPLSFKIKRVFQ